MARPPKTNNTAIVVAVEQIMENGRSPLPVYTPPNERSPREKQQMILAKGPEHNPIEMRGNLLRIQEQSDPLGFLIAVANGMPVPQYKVSEGKDGKAHVEVEYVVMPIDYRINVMKWLGNKILPQISVMKHFAAPASENQGSQDTSGFGAMLVNAAHKAGGSDKKFEGDQ